MRPVRQPHEHHSAALQSLPPVRTCLNIMRLCLRPVYGGPGLRNRTTKNRTANIKRGGYFFFQFIHRVPLYTVFHFLPIFDSIYDSNTIERVVKSQIIAAVMDLRYILNVTQGYAVCTGNGNLSYNCYWNAVWRLRARLPFWAFHFTGLPDAPESAVRSITPIKIY